MSLQQIIETAFENRAEITPTNVQPEVREAVLETLRQLDNGSLRVAERRGVGDWLVNEWAKKAVLLSFRIQDNELADDGVIFISLDDNEQSHLKLICDEIFGSHNFQAQIIVQSNKRGQTYKQIAKTHEYLLCYQKSDLAELGEFETDGENLDKADQWGQYSERELRNRNPKFGKFNRPNLFYPIFVNPNVCDEDGNCPLSSERTSETIEASTATGFVFQKAEADDLRGAIQHAFTLWQKQRVWARIRNNAMAQDFSWKNAAAQYEQLYLGILNQ